MSASEVVGQNHSGNVIVGPRWRKRGRETQAEPLIRGRPLDLSVRGRVPHLLSTPMGTNNGPDHGRLVVHL